MATVAGLAQSEMRITRILDSALDETLSLPTLEEAPPIPPCPAPASKSTPPSNCSIKWKPGRSDPAADVRIEVKARWFENSTWQERIVEPGATDYVSTMKPTLVRPVIADSRCSKW